MTDLNYERVPTIGFNAGDWIIDDGMTREDAATFAMWMGDPRIAKAMGRTPTISSAAHILAFANSLSGRGWLFMIRRSSDKQPVGHALVEVDTLNGSARVDVVTSVRGVNPITALDVFVATVGGWLFSVQHIYRVAVHSRSDNRHLRRWLDANLVHEGTIRGHIVDPGGKRVDQLVHSVVADEWRRVVGDAARRTGLKPPA